MVAMEVARLEMDDGVPAAPDAAETPPDAGAVQREEDVGPSVWHKAERENARRALLQHGLERWHEVCDRMYRDRALSGSALTPAPSPSRPSVVGFRRRNVDDVRDLAYDFLRAVHATVARKARADARDARDARDLHALESWARDRLKAASVGPGSCDRFVPDPHGVIGEWAKLDANAVPWARRLKTLDAVNLASERVFLEETRDDAEATLEAAFRNAERSEKGEKGVSSIEDAKEQSRRKDRVSRMPSWWDAACDAWLLRGCAAHGAFAPSSWDDVREDAACSAAFRDAAARRGEDVLRRFLRSLEEARERSEANKERGFLRRAGGDVVLDRKADAEPNLTAARIAGGREDDTGEKTSAVPRNDALEFDPCAWPSSETLSARVKRLAEVLGAPDATPPPADPPWVAAKLGRPRARKRVRVREKFAPADLALAAAEATREERKKRRKAKRDAMRHDAARVVDAMNRLAWTELAAAEGDAPEIAEEKNASGEASLRAARARVSDWTKADLMRLLRCVTAHGLPWRADVPGAPDWEHLARVSEFAAPRSAAQTRAAFHALALETSLILDVTGGKSRRAADTSDHDVQTCRCFVCGSKRRRGNEGGGDENENEISAESPSALSGAKPDEKFVVARKKKSLDAKNGDDEKSDKSGSDDAESDDDDDAFAIRPAVTERTSEPGEPGPSQGPSFARQKIQLRPFGLLTAVYATRALASLEILQVLRRAAATLGEVSSRETRDENENENVAVATAWPLPNMKTKDLPDWWDERAHFPALVRGVLKHGLANLDAVAEDPELPFAREKSERDTPGEALPPPRVCLRVLGIAARLYKRTILRDVM